MTCTTLNVVWSGTLELGAVINGTDILSFYFTYMYPGTVYGVYTSKMNINSTRTDV